MYRIISLYTNSEYVDYTNSWNDVMAYVQTFRESGNTVAVSVDSHTELGWVRIYV